MRAEKGQPAQFPVKKTASANKIAKDFLELLLADVGLALLLTAVSAVRHVIGWTDYPGALSLEELVWTFAMFLVLIPLAYLGVTLWKRVRREVGGKRQ